MNRAERTFSTLLRIVLSCSRLKSGAPFALAYTVRKARSISYGRRPNGLYFSPAALATPCGARLLLNGSFFSSATMPLLCGARLLLESRQPRSHAALAARSETVKSEAVAKAEANATKRAPYWVDMFAGDLPPQARSRCRRHRCSHPWSCPCPHLLPEKSGHVCQVGNFLGFASPYTRTAPRGVRVDEQAKPN